MTIFRIILFSFIGKIIFIFKRKKKFFSKKNIIVLGRGESLREFYKNYKIYKFIKDIFLVNFRKTDILYLDAFEGKRVHIVFNIEEVILSLYQIYKLNINFVYLNRFKELLDKKKFNITNKRKSYKGNVYGKIDYFYNPTKKIKNIENSGAGMILLSHLVENWKVKSIYLFGFDFYSNAKSHSESYKTVNQKKRHLNFGKKNFKNFLIYTQKNPNTNFFLCSKKKIKKKIRNLKLI